MKRYLRVNFLNFLFFIKRITPNFLRIGLFKIASVLVPEEQKIFGTKISTNWHIELLKKIGYNPSTVLDIGAYQGEWTSDLLNIFPNANFLMFEPQKSKKKYLSSLSNKYSNVYYEQVLVGI
jgi:tRNA G46 methylase TrmB